MAHDSYQPAIFAFSGHGQQLESFISITEPEGWVDQRRHLLQEDATMRSFFPASPDVEEHRSHGLSLSFRSNSFQPEKFFSESAAPARPAVTDYGSLLGRLMACKYLTPALQVLNELCNLGEEDLGVRSKQNSLRKRREKGGGTSHSSSALNYNFLQGFDILELQRRKAKLMVLLEEVDRRYKRYCEQMRAVVWPFEAEAGGGAAELYLALPSKAMSVHFRRLKDGILSQMQALKKAMGDKCPAAAGGKTPRLKVLDQCFRQQNAFRNCDMMDQHPWKPQRGLPERSVSILRAWLFEHFLHPYPNDIDKHILARQSGLSRGQVSNWFINARVRLWKPMIEEMYAKEVKDREAPQPAGDESVGRASKANANPDSEKEDEAQRNPMVGNERTSDLESLCSVVGLHRRSDTLPVIDNVFSSYNGYGSREVFRGNGVSLTLGLQQNSAGKDLSFSNQQNLFLDCQAVKFPILEAEVDEIPYRNTMRAELLHDLAR